MAITTLDGALAGMQPTRQFFKAISPTLVAGRYDSPWYRGGIPGAGSADTSTAGGVVRSSTSALVNGQIPHYDPGSGNAYLSRFTGASTQAGMLLLCDRLWDCGANSVGSALSPTSTASQTINSATWPARSQDGTTGGAGVLIGLEVSTILGSGTPTYTLTYTNSAGVGSHTGTNVLTVVTASAVGSFYTFGLQAGDVGVRSVQSIQASATQTSGQWVLVAYRIIDMLECPGLNVANSHDLLTGGFQQLFNGTVPMLLFLPNTTTASYYHGSVVETQG